MRTSEPSSVEGIEKYLGSGMIRGIGPVYARKLVRAFGEKVFDVIEAEPERLREVTGIGKVRAKRITDAWAEQKVDPRDHGVPAQPRRRHGAGGADIPDLRRRCRGGDDGEPLPPRARHPRHRFRDRRRHRDEARHREDGHGPGPRGHRLRPDRSDGRGSLRPAGRRAGTARGQTPGGSRRADPRRAGPGAVRRHGGCRHGGGDPLHIPRRPAPGRTRDRRASSRDRGRQSPMARHRPGQGPALGGGQDRARPGARPGRRGTRRRSPRRSR